MRGVVLCLVLALLLPGCASKYGEAHTQVHYYPACYRPIKDLRDREYSVEKKTAAGAVIGAFGGAMLGFLSTGKVEGALVGGVAGAATGAVVGNIYAKKQQIRDDNRRLASYYEELDGEIQGLNAVSAAAKVSLQCYDGEFQDLLQDIKARRVTRREAEERFGEIASGRDEAIKLLGKAITYGRDLDAQYEKAFVQEEQTLRRQPAKARASSVAFTRAKQQKKTFAKRVAEVAKEKDSAQAKSFANERTFSQQLEEIDA
ncbi:MAG: hypothetical protein IJS54_01790 [Desulfovibrio sp.]|nr:hypothetical protein [Desulfovibrio sp.]